MDELAKALSRLRNRSSEEIEEMWIEVRKKWDKRHEAYEQELKSTKPTKEQMETPFDF